MHNKKHGMDDAAAEVEASAIKIEYRVDRSQRSCEKNTQGQLCPVVSINCRGSYVCRDSQGLSV